MIHKVEAKAATGDDGNDDDWLAGVGDSVGHENHSASTHKRKKGKKGKRKH